eukprot:12917055-Prorocentrum_lima.AAC.1
MLAMLVSVEAGTVWEIRMAVYGLEKRPRLWQEKRYKALSKLTWYYAHWKIQIHLAQSRLHPSMGLLTKEP